MVELVQMQAASLPPGVGSLCRLITLEGSWFAQLVGMGEIASLIVTHGFRPVSAGRSECVGFGNGGRGSPGLKKGDQSWMLIRCMELKSEVMGRKN